jgi:hypothetical protein
MAILSFSAPITQPFIPKYKKEKIEINITKPCLPVNRNTETLHKSERKRKKEKKSGEDQ